MRRLKCYISSDGDSGLLGDTMQVLDALLASYASSDESHHHSNNVHHHSINDCYHGDNIHPVVSVASHHGNNRHCCRDSGPPPTLRLLYEACREQKNKFGCGVTSLVCLAAYWAPEILSLLKQVSSIFVMRMKEIYTPMLCTPFPIVVNNYLVSVQDT